MSENQFIKAIKPRLPILLLVVVLIVSVIIYDKKDAPEEHYIVTDDHSTTESTVFRRRVTTCRQIKPGQLEEMKRTAEEYFAAHESIHNQERTIQYIGVIVTTDSSGRTDSGIVHMIYEVQVDRDMKAYDGDVGYIWAIALTDIYPDGSAPNDVEQLLANVVRIDYDLSNPDPKENYRYFYGFESIQNLEEELKAKNYTVLDREIDERYAEGLEELSPVTNSQTQSDTTSSVNTETTETLPPSEG